MIFIGIMAFLFGVGIALLLLNHITWKNFNERVASFIIGGKNQWDSGTVVMQDAQPEQWSSIMWEDRLVQDNMPKIRNCQIAAIQVGQVKSCVIAIKREV